MTPDSKYFMKIYLLGSFRPGSHETKVSFSDFKSCDNIGEIHYHKENKTNGVNRLNSVQKATNLKKKIKSGNK